ncbi:uncharacterized protein LOC121079217 isoform X5 [Cygnus olor]|uniref:uncharacterized protein LOC121079217 isoform X5 n=1 Tax=Cygnus olor TaxID=8869 RepID=UPI001ADE4A57|nr:uncharacterized protein LOC121079217 isoform X5 [Cygnus olor]
MGGTATSTGTGQQERGGLRPHAPQVQMAALPLTQGFVGASLQPGLSCRNQGHPVPTAAPPAPGSVRASGRAQGGFKPGRVSGVKSCCAPAQLGLLLPAPSGRGAGTKSVNSTRPFPFPVQLLVFLLELEPRFSAAPMAPLCAALLARLLLGQLSLVLAWLSGAGAQADPSFQLRQPQKEVSVMVAETLTLTCTVSAGRPVGPVRWLKGWGSGNETIYDQKEPSSSRGTRAVNGSNTDFTILIRDVRPEDAGTYYCVKFRKRDTGDELYRRGEGTVVSVQAWRLQLPCSSSSSLSSSSPSACTTRSGGVRDRARVQPGHPQAAAHPSVSRAVQGAPGPPAKAGMQRPRGCPTSVEVAAAVLFFLLLIFILTFCVYHKKRRGEEQSQGAAGAPAGGCSPIRVPCCAGSPGTPSEGRDAETPRLPHQQSSEQDKDIHYADLQPLPEAPQRSQSPGADRSEYASIRGAAK